MGEVESNVLNMNVDIPDAFWRDLENKGLIPDFSKSAEATAVSTSETPAPLWQPHWNWSPLENKLAGRVDFCYCTDWFWRTLATARPSTGGRNMSAEVAAKRKQGLGKETT